MKVLILAPEYQGSGGGIMTFYQALVPALQAEGVQVRVIEGSALHASPVVNRRVVQGSTVETLELGAIARWHDRFSHLAAVPGLRRHLAAAWAMWEQAGFGEDEDIVEACDWGLLFIPPVLDANRPVLVQCHGSIGQISERDPIAGEKTQDVFTRLLERETLCRAEAVQTCSEANASYWRKQTGGEVSVQRPAWRRSGPDVGLSTNKRGLVVGRVQRWKGPQDLCAALRLLNGKGPQVDWIGRDTPWEKRDGSTCAHLARTYPDVWATRVLHQLPVSSDAVRTRQGAALFNLIPSVWDVFNFTAVEAMASGRPTIVSTGAGASELIESGVNGFTYPAGDAEKLAGVLDRVLSESPARLADIGRAAQETVHRALNPVAIAQGRIELYRSTIQAFRTRGAHAAKTSLEEVCMPSAASQRDDMSFLQHVPLRTLMRHVIGRLGQKAAKATVRTM